MISVIATSSFLFTSCATIVSHSSWQLSINTNPSDAQVEVVDDHGVTIASVNTPAALELKSGDGYFGKANYKLKFSKAGYYDKMINVGTSLNGWYLGNLVFGYAIGFFVVDPLTGAMYRLDEETISETLIKKGGETTSLLDSSKSDNYNKINK